MFQEQQLPQQEFAWLPYILEIIKILAPIAALIISAINLKYAIWMFKYKNQKEDEDKDRDRKIDWFKKLILDPNLPYFYEFFENVETECRRLNAVICSDQDKVEVESATLQYQIQLRRKFITNLSVVDDSLYDFILESTDELVGNINKSIFDPGINLTHKPMFEEKVLKPISETRTEILRKIFEYKGDINNKLMKK